jgi:prepilin-type N-terminal cleavage/methylation domain-containing protein
VTRLLRALRQSRGYTAVEVLTAMVILGIVLGGLLTVFVSSSNAQVEANRRFQAQQNARMALERMRREVHCANAVTPAGSSSLIVLSLAAGCPGAPAATTVTWCTRSVGTTRWEVARIAGTAGSCVGGTQYADYVTAANAFTFTAGTGGQLSTLRIDFPVDLTPADTNSAWRLTDDLVLRNDPR